MFFIVPRDAKQGEIVGCVHVNGSTPQFGNQVLELCTPAFQVDEIGAITEYPESARIFMPYENIGALVEQHDIEYEDALKERRNQIRQSMAARHQQPGDKFKDDPQFPL